MNARTWISLVNLIAIVVAFTVLFELPQYSGYAFYGLLGWILVSFILLYTLRVGRPSVQAGAAGTGPAGGTGVPAALPSSAPNGPAMALDFCIYCGATLPAGTAMCPTCGHPVRSV